MLLCLQSYIYQLTNTVCTYTTDIGSLHHPPQTCGPRATCQSPTEPTTSHCTRACLLSGCSRHTCDRHIRSDGKQRSVTGSVALEVETMRLNYSVGKGFGLSCCFFSSCRLSPELRYPTAYIYVYIPAHKHFLHYMKHMYIHTCMFHGPTASMLHGCVCSNAYLCTGSSLLHTHWDIRSKQRMMNHDMFLHSDRLENSLQYET